MKRRNLLTSLIGVFGLASTAKAEDNTKLAQLTAERNGYKAALLREKSRNESLKVLDSIALAEDERGLIINGSTVRYNYTCSIFMDGGLVGRCKAANSKEGWVEVSTDASKTTSCGPFTIEATSTEKQWVRTRVYGNVLIIGGSYQSFNIFQNPELQQALGKLYQDVVV